MDLGRLFSGSLVSFVGKWILKSEGKVYKKEGYLSQTPNLY